MSGKTPQHDAECDSWGPGVRPCDCGLTALREIVQRAEEQEKAANLLRDVRETFRFSRGDKANAHAEYVEVHRSACRATESAVRQWREKRGSAHAAPAESEDVLAGIGTPSPKAGAARQHPLEPVEQGDAGRAEGARSGDDRGINPCAAGSTANAVGHEPMIAAAPHASSPQAAPVSPALPPWPKWYIPTKYTWSDPPLHSYRGADVESWRDAALARIAELREAVLLVQRDNRNLDAVIESKHARIKELEHEAYMSRCRGDVLSEQVEGLQHDLDTYCVALGPGVARHEILGEIKRLKSEVVRLREQNKPEELARLREVDRVYKEWLVSHDASVIFESMSKRIKELEECVRTGQRSVLREVGRESPDTEPAHSSTASPAPAWTEEQRARAEDIALARHHGTKALCAEIAKHAHLFAPPAPVAVTRERIERAVERGVATSIQSAAHRSVNEHVAEAIMDALSAPVSAEALERACKQAYLSRPFARSWEHDANRMARMGEARALLKQLGIATEGT